MANVWVDREGECDFRVSWVSGAQPIKSRLFDSRDAAEGFAASKLGRRSGCVVSTLDMSAEQWAAEMARRARAATFLANLASGERSGGANSP